MSAHGTMDAKSPGELGYLEGFVPSSFDAPHSSLLRTSTWIGMGMILVSLAGFGTFVYGFAIAADDYAIVADNGNMIGIIGLIAGLFFFIAGGVLVHVGRTRYRAYKKATGRVQ